MMKQSNLLAIVSCALGLAALSPGALAEQLLEQQCASCHALQAEDYASSTVQERAERKAPPLYYAGNKFRPEWLVQWLQKPERIRPAGYFPAAHTVPGPDGDVVDSDSLPEHISLSAADAELASAALMKLTPYTDKLDAVDYEVGNISWRMGNLNFGKFNGCDACHRDAPDYGGLSGPELYSAWDRLQPKFIASFITDPVAWDPHTLMPANDLNPAAVQKLSDYLKVNGEDE